jgi:hypothetical protein
MSYHVITGGTVNPQVLQKYVDRNELRAEAMQKAHLRVNHLHHRVSEKVDTILEDTGAPPLPTSCSISITGVILNGQVWQEITATYTSPNPVSNFAGVFIVLKNYRGSSQLVKQAEDTFVGPGLTSKSFKFRLEKTGETVTFYFVPKNGQEGTIADWTSAPNVSSVLNVAAGSVTSTLPTNANSGTNVTYVLTSGNPLSNDGSSSTIQVAAFTLQLGFGQVSYNSGSVDPTLFGTYGVYFDDPTYSGGTVTFHATSVNVPVVAAEGRFRIGIITTSSGSSTGGDAGGSGDTGPLNLPHP